MTDDQHMQKAREVLGTIEGMLMGAASAIIATALSEAYRSGVEAERERVDALVEQVRTAAERFEGGVEMAGGTCWSAKGAIATCNDLATAIRKA